MFQVLLLSKDHRVYGGAFIAASSFDEVATRLRARGLDVSSPIGNSNTHLILILRSDVPGESPASSYRNPEWVNLETAAQKNQKIWEVYTDLLLGGWRPPAKSFQVFHFGAPGFMSSQLAHLVAKGRKRLTAGWCEAQKIAGLIEPTPGLISIVTDGFGIPICCIETESVEHLKFKDVTSEMAEREGEGDLTLEDWKKGHWEYWTTIEAPMLGLQFTVDSEIFVERFRLLKTFTGHQQLDRPSLILIVGLTGSGKTTLASKLAKERKLLQFSIDEWMKTLFWMDAPAQPDLSWALQRCSRVEDMILNLVKQELTRGHGAILDLGFSKKSERDTWKQRAHELNASVEVIYLDVPAEERWRRVQKRNETLSPSEQSIHVDRATFDWMEDFFEPLDADERKSATVLTTSDTD